jgi:hypothetical protein
MTVVDYNDLSEEEKTAKENGELKFNQKFLTDVVMRKSAMDELIKSKNPERRLGRIRAAREKAKELGWSDERIDNYLGKEEDYVSLVNNEEI